MKRIEIIPIAEKKSGRRGIKKEWIDDAIVNPMQVVEGMETGKLHIKNCCWEVKNIS